MFIYIYFYHWTYSNPICYQATNCMHSYLTDQLMLFLRDSIATCIHTYNTTQVVTTCAL